MSKVKISVKVTIGKASKGCAKFGVCNVTIGVGVNKEFMSYDQSANLMDITLSEAVIKTEQPDKLQYFEGMESVTFDEAYKLPEDVQTALKSDHPLIIPVGTFPLISQNGNYIIQNIRPTS